MTKVTKVKIEDGIVVEGYLLEEGKIPEHLQNWVTAPLEVGPGWLYNGESFSPPTEAFQWERMLPNRKAMKLSFSQFLVGLVTEGWISEEEGDAWTEGTLPSSIVTMIQTLPVEQQFAVRTHAKRMTEIARTDTLITLFDVPVDTMDNFFLKYRN